MCNQNTGEKHHDGFLEPSEYPIMLLCDAIFHQGVVLVWIILNHSKCEMLDYIVIKNHKKVLSNQCEN